MSKTKEVKLTKAGKPRKKPGRPPSKKKLYFGPEVQDAIVRYNTNPDNHALRNKIYCQEIHKAFDKLAENIINTFKFTYFDEPFKDVKHEVVAFMVMNIHKYDHTKGSKAFSYFSIVAKNYLILHNNANYKKLKKHVDVSKLNNYKHNKNEEHDEDMLALTDDVILYLEENIQNIFKKQRDIDISYAILELIKQRDEIENFNKKSLYILIREMTNVNTSHITSVVNVLKKHYKIILHNFFHSNSKQDNKIRKFF
jgi:hypothetical protein|tara:strand:+ start:131 stop:892 length:762 start_codon:yes stop_codon:yes gene_type:complete